MNATAKSIASAVLASVDQPDPGVGRVSILGVDFISLNESIDTATAMVKMVFTVLGAVAELKRNIIRERVTAGLRRAKKEGKTLGRPRVIVDRERVRQLHGQNGLKLQGAIPCEGRLKSPILSRYSSPMRTMP